MWYLLCVTVEDIHPARISTRTWVNTYCTIYFTAQGVHPYGIRIRTSGAM